MTTKRKRGGGERKREARPEKYRRENEKLFFFLLPSSLSVIEIVPSFGRGFALLYFFIYLSPFPSSDLGGLILAEGGDGGNGKKWRTFLLLSLVVWSRDRRRRRAGRGKTEVEDRLTKRRKLFSFFAESFLSSRPPPFLPRNVSSRGILCALRAGVPGRGTLSTRTKKAKKNRREI